MTCTEVRSMLPERSLGTLVAKDAAAVDRHVAWCAACRKEARELDGAAGSLVFALAPASPSAGLEDRVVQAVQGAVAAGAPQAHRRTRMAVAATAAAMIAVAGLGFGAVMAGRAARFRDQAITTKVATANAEARFAAIVNSIEFSDPRNSVEMGELVPVGGGPASGTALTLLAPSSQDTAILTVSALRLSPGQLPLQVTLVGPRRKIVVGTITKLDSGGGATIAAQTDADLSFFDHVVIRDAKGAALFRGTLTTRPLQSPSPSAVP